MNEERGFNLELLFRALADRTRLRLLNLMGADEVCVCYLVEALKMSQPKISRHLAYLRRAGVVAARREGKWMHYRIVEPSDSHARIIFTEVRAHLAENRGMRRDQDRFMKLCYALQPPVQLRRAPRPTRVGKPVDLNRT